MRYITASIIVGLLLVLAACVPSLHPLYTVGNQIAEAYLVVQTGFW